MRTKHAFKFKAKVKERLSYLEGLEGNSKSGTNGKTATSNIIFILYLIKIENWKKYRSNGSRFETENWQIIPWVSLKNENPQPNYHPITN